MIKYKHFLATVALLAGSFVQASTERFKHPQRFETVKKELIIEGVTPQRVEEIFESRLFRPKDSKAVAKISDISRIKKHRKAERQANKQLLLKSALIKRHLKKYKRVYDITERDFGVNREIIAAILQKETALGAFKSYQHNALTAFVTMLDKLELPKHPSERIKRRHKRLVDFAMRNLVALILHFEQRGKDVLTADLRSSYAGAIGIPQFTPQHFDMVKAPPGEDNLSLHHMPTAIYSTANLLKNRFHWDEMVDFSEIKKLKRIKQMWYAFDDGTANFVYHKNLDGQVVPNFVKAYPEDAEIVYVGEIVKVLKRYNFSTAYALGIIEIAKKVHRN